jgi:hypothetical protein
MMDKPNMSKKQADEITDYNLSYIRNEENPEKWKHCPNKIPYNCIYKDQNGEFKICERSPCLLTRFRVSKNEQIIDHYIFNGDYYSAYYHFRDTIAIERLKCDSNELDDYSDTNESLKGLSSGCKLFIYQKRLKQAMRTIRQIKNKGNDLTDHSKEQLKESKERFISTMENAIQTLAILANEIQKEVEEKSEAHRREVHTMMTMEATKVQFQGTFGTEVDKNAQERQKTLMPNDPELQKDTGLFSTESNILKKRRKQKQRESEA